jgi:phosphate starvation-inducible PhoH-like protein
MNIRLFLGMFVSMAMGFGLRSCRGVGLSKYIHMKSKSASLNTFKVELPDIGQGTVSLQHLTTENAKRSREFGRTKKTKIQKIIPTYVPRGANQQKYVDYLTNPDTSIVFGIGPAGCGKTLFACCSAIQSFKSGNITKIILTRPAVSVEEDLGFLPGDILRKMDPWLQPLFDVFLEHYTQSELDMMIERGVIEIAPLGYMRGRTFHNVFILADEMQNSSPMQMKMLLTRIGEGSKMVVTGDLKQSDWNVKNSRKGSWSDQGGVLNGLADFMGKFSRESDTDICDIGLVEMTANDVERSQVVRRVLKIYDDVRSTKVNEVESNKPMHEKRNVSPSDELPCRSPEYGDAALIPLHDIIKLL